MASAVKAFDMQSKDVWNRNEEAVSCLNAWSQFLSETMMGKMTVKGGEMSVSIELVANNAGSFETELSSLLVHHTYVNICKKRPMGCAVMQKQYTASVRGKDAQGISAVFILYFYRTCEDGESWSSTLDVRRMKGVQLPAEGKE